MAQATATDLGNATVAVFRLDLENGRAERPAPVQPDDRVWMEPLLQQNAVWFCQLRWLVVAGLGAAGLISLFPHWLAEAGLALSPWWPLGAALFLACSNLVFVRLTSRTDASGRRANLESPTMDKVPSPCPLPEERVSSDAGLFHARHLRISKASLPESRMQPTSCQIQPHPQATPSPRGEGRVRGLLGWLVGPPRYASGYRTPVRLLLWAQIVSDLFVLTAVIHWLGHQVPVAPFMYLFHVMLACIVFTPGESLAVAGLAAGFYLISLLMESAGLLPPAATLSGQASDPAALTSVSRGFSVFSMLLIWSVIWYLVSRLASAFRSRDRELFISNRRLRASIEERSQHMLQTTHQLKAPFAAIHAQAQLLLGEYCGALPARARVTVEKISARCLVLARQIQEMLQLANLRSQGQMAPPKTSVHLDSLIEELITRIEPAARARGIRFDKQIQPLTIDAVADHLTMLVDNLLVNAVNYSFQDGVVQVCCRGETSGTAIVTVRDRGIGIPREKLPRIFDDYYRTEEAVQHNRASTGLGLAIVRQVACKDHLPVLVESAPGWGTRFTVTLPAALAIAPAPNSHLNN